MFHPGIEFYNCTKTAHHLTVNVYVINIDTDVILHNYEYNFMMLYLLN